jgi:DNA-3-methyladenine glycosylase II
MDVALRLTTDILAEGVAELARRDRHLAAVVARHGAPPLWDRPPGFETLVQIILEQQVSLASGRAAYARLERVAGAVTPELVARLDDAALQGAGLTRQKASYIRGLAEAIVAGEFDPDSLAALDDEDARTALIKLRGVGAWTADIYLLMALGRSDIWPSGDLALVAAIREVKRMRSIPSADRLGRITRAWRPWRAVAARVLWHHYLSTPRTRMKVSDAQPSSRRTAALSRRPAQKDPRSADRSRTPSRASAATGSSKRAARTPRGGRTPG